MTTFMKGLPKNSSESEGCNTDFGCVCILKCKAGVSHGLLSVVEQENITY